METIQEVSEDGENTGGQWPAKGDLKGFKAASLSVLDQVKINVEPESPVSTLKNVLKTTKDKRFTKSELKRAEGLLTQAFTEFYNKLRLMKSFWYYFVGFMVV